MGGKLIFIDEETFSSSKLISDTINVYSNQQKNFIKKIKTKYSFEEILNFLKKNQRYRMFMYWGNYNR